MFPAVHCRTTMMESARRHESHSLHLCLRHHRFEKPVTTRYKCSCHKLDMPQAQPILDCKPWCCCLGFGVSITNRQSLGLGYPQESFWLGLPAQARTRPPILETNSDSVRAGCLSRQIAQSRTSQDGSSHLDEPLHQSTRYGCLGK